MIVTVNNFVRRQKKNSGKTYSPDLSFEEIAYHAQNQMIKGFFKEGYREGVRVVFAKTTIINKSIKCITQDQPYPNDSKSLS